MLLGHKSRRVKKVQNTQLEECLKEEKQRQLTEIHNNCPLAPVVLTEGVIRAICGHSKNLFSENDILKVVGCRYTAKQVYHIIATIFGDITTEAMDQEPMEIMD